MKSILAEVEKKHTREAAEALIVAVLRDNRHAVLSALIGLGFRVQEARELAQAAYERFGDEKAVL